MDSLILYSFFGILLLCLTHFFVNKLRLSGIPRSKWLSVAGGISVTYIFLEAFPELQEFQAHLSKELENIFSIPGYENILIYIISLLGLTFFYGLENRTKKSTLSTREPAEGEEVQISGIFWIHIFSFAFYNFIIGYLLLNREEKSFEAFLLYSVAMAFHFMVTDHSLEDHFRSAYKTKGRWILISFLILGWLLSIFFTIPEVYIAIVFAFLAGGIIMNVLKEELPKERDSNFFAFLSGIVLYTVLLGFV